MTSIAIGLFRNTGTCGTAPDAKIRESTYSMSCERPTENEGTMRTPPLRTFCAG